MRLLWLLPDLAYSSAARQAQLLTPEFARQGHQIELAVLRSGGPLTALILSQEITLRELSSPNDVPFRAIGELEKVLRTESYDVIHAWRLPTMRTMATLRMARQHRPRLVVSQIDRGGRWNPLDRLLRQKADRVMPDFDGAQSVPLAVRKPSGEGPPFDLPIPPQSRLIVSLGQLTPEHGFRDAVWAFDVLKFVYPDIHLVIIGDGPERDRLVHFSQRLGGNDVRTHFVRGNTHPDVWLRRAAVVWVPSRKPCGEQVALEAQSAEVPVVATTIGGLPSLITNQLTGILVKPGDPVAMAMATRPLLDNPELPKSMVQVSQSNLTNHQIPEVAAKWLQIYADTCKASVA